MERIQENSKPSAKHHVTHPAAALEQRQISGTQAILEALDQSLTADRNVVVFGIGVSDPKGVFGTTLDLHKKHGLDRVFDGPVSENALTGMAVGASLFGIRPVLVHQRVDFALLSVDQLINNAAKWHYMFDGQYSVPIVIRMIIGRGWGQGPQHSQSLQALFAHIPGLKVVMPATPYDLKGMLISSIEDNNPVIFMEHRWSHGIKGHVPEEMYRVPLGKAKVVRPGKDLTMVAASFMVLEAQRAADELAKSGIEAEVIDLRSISPWDHATVAASLKKTGHLMVLDTGHQSFGISAEIVAKLSETSIGDFKRAPVRVTSPDVPCPTAPALAISYYPRSSDVYRRALDLLGVDAHAPSRKGAEVLFAIERSTPSDVPDTNFKGPF